MMRKEVFLNADDLQKAQNFLCSADNIFSQKNLTAKEKVLHQDLHKLWDELDSQKNRLK